MMSAQGPEAESKKVYSAAFDFLFRQYKGESPGTIVLMDSTSWDAGAVAYKGELLQPHQSQIDRETIKDFEELNRVPSFLPSTAVSYRLPIVFLTLAEWYRLDTAGRKILLKRPYSGPEPGSLMDAFAAKFPHAWGISAVSRVGFNKARTQALVLIAHNCGRCYHSETLAFRKSAGKWIFQERIPFRSSDGIGPGETRYLGADAQYLPRLRRSQDSTRKAVADSIALDKAPRRIRGTVTNRQTGRPLARAQIFVRARDLTPAPRTVTDSRGRYEFRNLPIGGTMLELQCPGSDYQPGGTLDAPSFYMFPALDTAINLVAPDLRPCWLPRRVHRIESGELETTPLGVASADNDDASVFASVVANLYPIDSQGRQQALVTQKTYQRCKRLAECPSIKFAALIREGTLDSSTVRDFGNRSKEIRALTRSESQRAGITLLTDGERQYLHGEGYWVNYGHTEADSPEGVWMAITTIYPGTKAIVSFTAPGFDRSRREALVEVMIETPAGGEENETILLRKTDEQWALEKRHVESAIVSGKMIGGRCDAVTPDSIPSVSDLSMISGEYRFSFISDTGDGKVIDWRARFSPDTTELPRIDLNKLTPEQRQRFIDQRDHRFPWFEVLDAKTGERRKFAEAGTYMESADRHFRSKSGLMQFDGSGYFIDIRTVGKDALFGTWQAFSFGVRFGVDGFVIPEPAGHFCASRVSATH